MKPSKSAQSKPKHQRLIRMSVVVPASVELLVGTNDDEPGEDSDWEILAVRDARCEATPTTIAESMHDADFGALAALAAKTKDIA